MSPDNFNDTNEPENHYDFAENDLNEIAAVDESLEELNTILDSFEKRADQIMEHVKELLEESRIFRKQLAEEQESQETNTTDEQLKK